MRRMMIGCLSGSPYTYLYRRGTAYVTVTEVEVSGGTVTQEADKITIIKTGSISGSAYVDLPINWDLATTAYIAYKTNSYTSAPRLIAMSGTSGDTVLSNVTLTSSSETVASLDVSSFTGNGRLRVGYWSDMGQWNNETYEVYYI